MAVLESSMEEKSPKHSTKSKKKALLLAQDLNYARNLAANEEKVRNRSLKYLKKYLEQRSQASSLTEENLRVLWKGLFYAMWMSDKPLIQEECAENIAHLIHCLQFEEAMMFFKTGLVTLQNEWIGIDQIRLDKFLMLVRRLLRQAMLVLKKFNFKKHPNKTFAKILEDTILNVTKEPPLGLFMHFTEIYLEELAKVSDGKLQPARTLDFLKPYIIRLAFANDNRVIHWINKFIFTHLMKQHKLGLEYEDKYNIWKMQGFVGSINQIQKVVVPDEEWEEQYSDNEEQKQSPQNKPLDPRAGRVDVELPQILFDAKEISEALLELKRDPKTSKVTRNHLLIWSERYQKLHNGVYPIGVKKLESKKRRSLDNYDTDITKAAKRLIKFEQKLLAREGGKNKRKRADSDNQDEDLDNIIPKKKKKKDVQIENTKRDDSINRKKNKKDKVPKDKSVSVDKINKIESNRKPEKHKSSKKLNNLESETTSMKNEVKRKIKEKKMIQKENTHRLSSVSDDDYNYDYCFERNSGVWYVTPQVIDRNDTLNKSSKAETEAGENGEYAPSKKFVKKLKKTKTDKDVEHTRNTIQEVEQVLSKLRGKSRTSLNFHSNQKLNDTTPRKSTSTSGSPKKVVINTKLNISQDIDDHILQVISSPKIPWDSSKKPGKPLLKTPVKASPINPFYRLKTF